MIGCGWHASTTVVPAVLAAGAEVRAVCSRHVDTAQAAARRVGAPAWFGGVDELLARCAGDVDACVAVLPADGYESVVNACLDAGLPVYCEKPAALDSATLLRMETRAAAAGIPVMVGYMKRFAPAYQRARELMAEESFGRPLAIQVRWAVGAGRHDLDYLVRENVTHVLDITRHLVGEVEHVDAAAFRAHGGVAGVAAMFRAASGAVGTLEASSAGSWDHVNETVTVTGEGCTIIVDNVEQCTVRVRGEPERRWLPNHTLPVQRNSSAAITGFLGAILHFARVVAGEEACRSDIGSARRTMEFAEAIAAAARA